MYWYHEIVTYSRKLLLGGISVVMGRGMADEDVEEIGMS